MEATALSAATSALSLLYSVSPSFLHKWSYNPAASYTELPSPTIQFYIRQDNGKPDVQVNVFDASGTQLYSFERSSGRSTRWVLFSTKDRTQMAAITLGLRTRSISYLQRPDMRYQLVNGLLMNSFNLNDGTTYQWTRGTRLLERVVNPGGGFEEVHQRLASVNLLRRFQFDWELVVHKGFDAQVAICTAFVAANTIWSNARTVGTPTVIA